MLFLSSLIPSNHYLLHVISALLELHVPGGLEYSLTTTTNQICQFLHLSKLKQCMYGLPDVFDKFAYGSNCTSRPMQQPPFMTITPWGSESRVCVHQLENRTASLQVMEHSLAHGPDLWLHFTKSNPNLERGLVAPSLLDEYLIA